MPSRSGRRRTLLTVPLWVAIALPFTGCGDDDGGSADAANGPDTSDDVSVTDTGPLMEPGDSFRSGTRLVARLLNGLPLPFRDSELDLECEFVEASSGEVRCLPSNRIRVAFTDAACSAPIAHQRQGDLSVGSIVISNDGCDRRRYAAVSVGETLPTPSVLYRLNSGDNCEEFDPSDGDTYESLTVLADDMFVGATRNVTNVTEMAGVVHFEGEDGSRAVSGFYDRTLDHPCEVGWTTADRTRCLVETGRFVYRLRAGGANIRTADCMEDLITQTHCADTDVPPLASVTSSEDVCSPTEYALVRLGEEVPASMAVNAQRGMCPSGPASSENRYFRLGEALSDAEHVALYRVRVGTERIQPQWWGLNEGSATLPQTQYFDRDLGVGCNAERANGTDFCFPEPQVYASIDAPLFEDDGCTQPLAAHRVGSCGAPPPQYVSETGFGPTGEFEVRVFEIGAEVTGMSDVYTGEPGACTAEPRRSETDYYRVGNEVPANSVMAELTVEEL